MHYNSKGAHDYNSQPLVLFHHNPHMPNSWHQPPDHRLQGFLPCYIVICTLFKSNQNFYDKIS